MTQEKLWKKWLLIIIWIAILLIGLFLVLKINWAKDTAKEKWNDIKESVNQWWLVEDTNWSDEEQEVKIYSIFHEWKDDDEDKYKDLEYNFGDYYNDNTESNNDNYEIYENDYDYNYNNDYNF